MQYEQKKKGNMNIFFLDKDPKTAAQMQCDKHVVKMVLETAQMLSTAARKQGYKLGYKPAYPKHPMTRWFSKSPNNYSWVIKHGLALGTEYQLRYHRVHKSHEVIKELAIIDKGDSKQITEPPQCMPDEYKNKNYIKAYRNYYLGDKKRFARYTNRKPPPFMKLKERKE